MKVNVFGHPRKAKGLSINWSLSSNWSHEVALIKRCLGFSFDKGSKLWMSEGPEVLLDMHRFGIGVEYLAPEARPIAEEFRQQIWDTMDCRRLDIDDEMYGYQRQGSKFLSLMPTAILGDDMGTGKSKQSLDAAAIIGAKRILVVCPKTLCFNWANEVAKWHPELSYDVIPDSPRERIAFWDREQLPNVVITNYEKLLLNDWPKDEEWDVLICDEASKLKNYQTKTYKKVKSIAPHCRYTWALTGTPLEIRVEELHSILSLLRPSVLGSFYRFREAHLQTDWAGTVVGTKDLDLLRERIAPFILRRTKHELREKLQIPEKQYQNIYIKMSSGEKEAYESFKSEFNNWLTDHGVSGGSDPLVQTLRMRQFTSSPAIFTDDLGKGSKFEAIKDFIEDWDGLIVLFCFFKEAVDLYHQWLGAHPEAIISGDISASKGERIRRAEAFSAGKLGKVLLCTEAGDKGINIPGANCVIHIDQLWNPQIMNQREDRLHRIGQKGVVNVVNALCIDTIDNGMWLLNRERETLFKEVIDGAEESILRKLSAPRLRRIIEGRIDE